MIRKGCVVAGFAFCGVLDASPLAAVAEIGEAGDSPNRV